MINCIRFSMNIITKNYIVDIFHNEKNCKKIKYAEKLNFVYVNGTTQKFKTQEHIFNP